MSFVICGLCISVCELSIPLVDLLEAPLETADLLLFVDGSYLRIETGKYQMS